MKIKFAVLPLLFVLSVLPVFSQNQARERVVDNAGLLNSVERFSLVSRLDYIAEKYRIDLVIVTEKGIGGSNPMNYAYDFFDYNGYGLGNDRDGCLFLIVTGTRDYWISTSGRAINILNTYAYKKLESDAVKSLRGNDYYTAFNSFSDNWEKFLILESKGRRYNFFYQWNIVLVISGWLIALAIGFIVVLIWKNGMNTALLKTQADSYIIPGSLAFNEKKDTFLYSVVSKTEKQQKDDSLSGGKTHTSSSGRTHGGGGGKF